MAVDDWVSMPLGEFVTLQRGHDLPDSVRTDGPVPVIGSFGVTGWHDKWRAPGPGVAVGRSGASFGTVTYSGESFWPLNTALYVTDFHGNDPRFAYYLLRSFDFSNYNSGSAQPSLNRNHIHPVPVRVPSLDQQRRIAHILGTLDDKVELNRRMNETLEETARAVFKSWFVDFDPVRAKAEGRDPGLPAHLSDLFPDRFVDSELGEIPGGWSAATIGSVAEVIDCLHSTKPERQDTGSPLLQLNNIRDDGLLDTRDLYLIDSSDYGKWVSRMEASPGDCVITNVGRVGAVAQVPPGFAGALGRNMTGLRSTTDFPYPTFLLECLRSSAMSEEIVRKSDAGTILDALNVRSIPKLRFVRGQEPVVAEFESLCRPLRARMESNLAESHSLMAIRDALLPRLVSGELSLPRAEQEAALEPLGILTRSPL